MIINGCVCVCIFLGFFWEVGEGVEGGKRDFMKLLPWIQGPWDRQPVDRTQSCKSHQFKKKKPSSTNSNKGIVTYRGKLCYHSCYPASKAMLEPSYIKKWSHHFLFIYPFCFATLLQLKFTDLYTFPLPTNKKKEG